MSHKMKPQLPQFTRRTFLHGVSAAGAIGAAGRIGIAQSEEDPLGVRSDFPVTNRGVYLNSPYITPSPKPAVEAARQFALDKSEDPVSLGRMLEETVAVRNQFAQLIGASEEEIGLLFATSEGENIVARSLDLKAGENVVIDDLHYETTFVLYRRLAETLGFELRIVRSAEGEAPAEAFARQVDGRTRLISVAWVSHQNGYCHDLSALAKLAHRHEAYLYTDAIQGIGMLPLDVRKTGVDFLTAGTYKWLLGGFGVAPFYVRRQLLDKIRLDRFGSLHIENELDDHRFELYNDARKYGYATFAFGAVYQLKAALDYLLKVGVKRIQQHTIPLAHQLREGLVSQGYRVWTPANNRSSIVTYDHGQDPDQVRSRFNAAGIKVSFKDNDRKIRIGPALFNNASEIELFLETTARLQS